MRFSQVKTPKSGHGQVGWRAHCRLTSVLYQWHKFPSFHVVDWAIGIALLLVVSFAILYFTENIHYSLCPLCKDGNKRLVKLLKLSRLLCKNSFNINPFETVTHVKEHHRESPFTSRLLASYSIHPSLLLLGALPAHAHHPREVLRERAVGHGRRGGLDGGGDLGGEGAGGPRHGGRGAGHERLKVAANCLLQLAQRARGGRRRRRRGGSCSGALQVG